MNAVYRATGFAVCLAICLALLACGNKGALYLDKIELSAEQKALLEANDANSANEVIDSDDEKTKKKKKADGTQTTQ